MRRPDRGTGPDRAARRMALELAAAVSLYLLYLAACALLPSEMAARQETLRGLLSGSADLWAACEQLGEDLAGGEDVASSVGEWCIAVFLPEETPAQPPEEDRSDAPAG